MLWKRVTSAGEQGLSAWKHARQNRFLQFPISLPHGGGERKGSYSPLEKGKAYIGILVQN